MCASSSSAVQARSSRCRAALLMLHRVLCRKGAPDPASRPRRWPQLPLIGQFVPPHGGKIRRLTGRRGTPEPFLGAEPQLLPQPVAGLHAFVRDVQDGTDLSLLARFMLNKATSRSSFRSGRGAGR